MAQIDPDRYKRLSGFQTTYGRDDGVFWDSTNGQIVFVLNDAIVARSDATGITADLEFSGEARGDILRRAASAWAAYSAKTSGQILVGDGTDIASVAVSGDVALTGAGVATVTDLTISSEARGDLLRRGASAWQRFAAKTAGSLVYGDGTDVTTLAIGSGGQQLVAKADASALTYDSGKIFKALLASMQAADAPTNFESDFTAAAGATGALNVCCLPGGQRLGYWILGAGQTITGPVAGAASIDIACDQIDNEGLEVFSHWGPAHGVPLSVGHDAAFYMLVKLNIQTINGCDDLFVGFRKVEAQNAAMESYDTYFGLGLNTAATPGALKVRNRLNAGGADNTDTTQTIASGTDLQIKVLISASGVATVQHDAAVPGTLAAPTQTAALTFDDGDQIIPVIRFLHANAAQAGTILIKTIEVGYT